MVCERGVGVVWIKRQVSPHTGRPQRESHLCRPPSLSSSAQPSPYQILPVVLWAVGQRRAAGKGRVAALEMTIERTRGHTKERGRGGAAAKALASPTTRCTRKCDSSTFSGFTGAAELPQMPMVTTAPLPVPQVLV